MTITNPSSECKYLLCRVLIVWRVKDHSQYHKRWTGMWMWWICIIKLRRLNFSCYCFNPLVSSWQQQWWSWSNVRYGPRDWWTGKQWWQTWPSKMGEEKMGGGWGENVLAKILMVDAEELGSPLSCSWVKKFLTTSLSWWASELVSKCSYLPDIERHQCKEILSHMLQVVLDTALSG